MDAPTDLPELPEPPRGADLPVLTTNEYGDLVAADADGDTLFLNRGMGAKHQGAEVVRRCNGWESLVAAARHVITRCNEGDYFDMIEAAVALQAVLQVVAPDPADVADPGAAGSPAGGPVTAEQIEEARLRG